MRGFAEYLASCVLIVAILAAGAAAFLGGGSMHPVLVSAALAVVVQLVAFGIARALRDRNLVLGWGLGSMLRLVALVIYAVVVARLWRASLAPALVSFGAFLFLTTIVEPVFLKR